MRFIKSCYIKRDVPPFSFGIDGLLDGSIIIHYDQGGLSIEVE